MATSLPLGIVSLKAEGAYSADKLYKKGMWVTSSGSSYAYINPTPAAGVPVTDTSHWQQIAEKGDKGIQGPKGDTGAQGPIGNVMYATFNIDSDTGELVVTIPDGYTGPTFAINDETGELEVSI